VVYKTKVSVVRNVLCNLAGQFMISGAQAMTVAIRVVKTVEVLKCVVGEPRIVSVESEVGAVSSKEEETDKE
jgi:hypothetical protein